MFIAKLLSIALGRFLFGMGAVLCSCKVYCAGDLEDMSQYNDDRRVVTTEYVNRRFDEDHEKLYVTPTIDSGAPYVPIDISDAWRELDRMLPEEYRMEVARHYSSSVCIDTPDGPLVRVHWSLTLFLQRAWFRDDKRFLDFMGLFFTWSKSERIAAGQRSVAMAMVLCGYYAKERDGSFPKISKFVHLAQMEAKRLERKYSK